LSFFNFQIQAKKAKYPYIPNKPVWQGANMSLESEKLDFMLVEYRQGRINRKELESRIFLKIKNNPRRFYLSKLKEDARDDFISWLYPRLSRAIDNYTDRGSSFDAYIITLVRLSAKEYGLQKREHQIIERTWWDEKAQEMTAAEEEPEYLDNSAKPKKVSNPRQVLMLLLKSYYFLSDSHIEKLAPSLGLEKEELFYMVDNLRILRVQQEDMISCLKERIHSQFYRCLAFERRKKSASPGSAHYYKMERSLKIARKRLASMRKRLQVVRMEASNEQVAKIMGVAKGTIDSNLYAVRTRNKD
jgi:DNA-directed RNA polymerase specialized sigma24 family protein